MFDQFFLHLPSVQELFLVTLRSSLLGTKIFYQWLFICEKSLQESRNHFNYYNTKNVMQ